LDEFLEESGHPVLCLPPYDSILNRVDNCWALIKEYVAGK